MKNTLFIFILLSFTPLASSANTPETVNQLLIEEQYEKALSAATEGLENQPENRVMLLQKGFLLIKLRQLDEAESHYQNVIEVIPDDPEPMNNLGVVYQLQRQYGKAIAQLNETIKKFPDFIQAYENLGDTYIQIATAQYIAGRERAPSSVSLVSKADLGQRFYIAAKENAESALARQDNVDDAIETTEHTTVSEENTVDSVKVVESELAEFLRSWVAGWSSKDTESYLSHYSDSFTPSQGRSLESWKERKQKIINDAEFIKIRVEGIQLDEIQGTEADLSFDFSYESDSYQSDSRKALKLNKEESGWLITAEK